MSKKLSAKALMLSIFSVALALTAFNYLSLRPSADRLHTCQLRLCIAADPIHIDPAFAGDSVSALVLRMIYEGLSRLDDTGTAQPALAESWNVSPDGKRYTFFLRPAYWSNGQKIVAQDFVFAWKRLLDPAVAAPNAYLLFVIHNARLIKQGNLPLHDLGAIALDENTLQVDLEHPASYFLQLTAFDAFYPVCPNAPPPSNHLDTLVHCGPFSLKNWKLKNEIVLEPNPTYWDRQQVKIKQIKFLVIADSQTCMHMYESGDIDWLGSPLTPLPIEANESLAARGLLQVYSGSSTYWLHCNLRHPLLKNAKARQALSMALDRSTLVQSLGLQHEPAYRLVPPVLSAPDASVLTIKESKARAIELWNQALQEEGVDASAPLEMIYNTSGIHAKVAQVVQSQWLEHLGAHIDLQGLEWAIFLNRVKRGQFDIARFGWRAQFADPSTFLDIFENSQGAYNFSRWEDPLYQHDLQQSRKSGNDQRSAYLRLAESRLDQCLPVIPLFFESYTYVKNPHLKGIIIGPLGRIDFKFAYWENEKN